MNESIVEQFTELIEDIVSLDEKDLTQDKVDFILNNLKDNFNQNKETIRQELLSGRSHFEVKNMLDDYNSAKEKIINELELSGLKKELLQNILNEISNTVEEAISNKDTVVHFELCHPDAKVPTYAHDTDAGADIYAPEDITIPAGASGFLVNTGFKMALENGWEAQIRSRSGMARKTGLRISNGIGTIDSSYRDLVGVLFDNISDKDYEIKKGDRIAQMVVAPNYHFSPQVIDDITSIEGNRNGGWGSSGR